MNRVFPPGFSLAWESTKYVKRTVCFHPRGKFTVLDLLPISLICELRINLPLCQKVPQITHTTRAKAHLAALEFFKSYGDPHSYWAPCIYPSIKATKV